MFKNLNLKEIFLIYKSYENEKKSNIKIVKSNITSEIEL